MTYTFDTEIHAPLAKVAQLVGDPAKRMQWMDGIESYEQLSGKPGAAGSTAKMVFQAGRIKVTMTGTILKNELPASLVETVDASNLTSTVTTSLTAIDPNTTKYTSQQTFAFKGLFNKIVGFLLQGEFKKQTKAHMAGLKRLAEKA